MPTCGQNLTAEKKIRAVTSHAMKMYKNMINENKKCYKHLHHNKSDENVHKYKEVRRNAKKTVNEAIGQAYAEVYRKLDMIEGKNDIYKMTKL
jgi:hypothetical protein